MGIRRVTSSPNLGDKTHQKLFIQSMSCNSTNHSPGCWWSMLHRAILNPVQTTGLDHQHAKVANFSPFLNYAHKLVTARRATENTVTRKFTQALEPRASSNLPDFHLTIVL
eukprot:240698-Pelagomonas_calceolata.AAC.3